MFLNSIFFTSLSYECRSVEYSLYPFVSRPIFRIVDPLDLLVYSLLPTSRSLDLVNLVKLLSRISLISFGFNPFTIGFISLLVVDFLPFCPCRTFFSVTILMPICTILTWTVDVSHLEHHLPLSQVSLCDLCSSACLRPTLFSGTSAIFHSRMGRSAFREPVRFVRIDSKIHNLDVRICTGRHDSFCGVSASCTCSCSCKWSKAYNLAQLRSFHTGRISLLPLGVRAFPLLEYWLIPYAAHRIHVSSLCTQRIWFRPCKRLFCRSKHRYASSEGFPSAVSDTYADTPNRKYSSYFFLGYPWVR